MFLMNPMWIVECLGCAIWYDKDIGVCPNCHVAKKRYPIPQVFDRNSIFRGDQMPGKVQFINYTLTKTDKADVTAHMNDTDWMTDAQDAVQKAGFRLVLSYDAKQECFVAFVFPQGEEGAFQGYSISSRGSTSKAALAVVLWKHLVLYDGSWPLEPQGKRFPVDI